MIYTRWNDEELRRALNADPEDADAIIEAAERFRKGTTEGELEKKYEEGYEEGYEGGYAAGQEDAQPMDCPHCGEMIE